MHPLAFPENRSGALGMKAGDRVILSNGSRGTADEFLSNGETLITLDNGLYTEVNWNSITKEVK